MFSKTAGFRHDSIPAGIAAIQALGTREELAGRHHRGRVAVHGRVLSHYDVVIFLSTTGDVLNAAQQTAFENYIKSGKGYVGIHAAADGEYDWRWYGNLVGAYFRNHPAGTPQRDGRHGGHARTRPRRAFRPAGARTDEWYNYKAPSNANGDDYCPAARPGVHVLLTMDESTYAEDDGNDGVDDDHPISWCQRYDGGRSFYTGLGHTQASFPRPASCPTSGPGIEIAAGVLPSAACGVAPPVGGRRRGRSSVGGTVPSVLALTLGDAASLGTFMPGVTRDYTASLAGDRDVERHGGRADRARPEQHRSGPAGQRHGGARPARCRSRRVTGRSRRSAARRCR